MGYAGSHLPRASTSDPPSYHPPCVRVQAGWCARTPPCLPLAHLLGRAGRQWVGPWANRQRTAGHPWLRAPAAAGPCPFGLRLPSPEPAVPRCWLPLAEGACCCWPVPCVQCRTSTRALPPPITNLGSDVRQCGVGGWHSVLPADVH